MRPEPITAAQAMMTSFRVNYSIILSPRKTEKEKWKRKAPAAASLCFDVSQTEEEEKPEGPT